MGHFFILEVGHNHCLDQNSLCQANMRPVYLVLINSETLCWDSLEVKNVDDELFFGKHGLRLSLHFRWHRDVCEKKANNIAMATSVITISFKKIKYTINGQWPCLVHHYYC